MTGKQEQEPTVLVELGGRNVEVRRPTDGALVVLARVSRGIPSSDFDPEQVSEEQRQRLVRNLGTIGKVVESMIVSDADKDWLDDVMVSGEVTPEECFAMIATAAKLFSGETAAPKKAAAAVRRRRS